MGILSAPGINHFYMHSLRGTDRAVRPIIEEECVRLISGLFKDHAGCEGRCFVRGWREIRQDALCFTNPESTESHGNAWVGGLP